MRVVTEPKTNFIETQCAAKGMRMTEQRRVIARVIAGAADHPDVEELYRRCAKIDEHISISTVYRTVKLFEDAGIIERHDFREGRSRYEQMRETHHDHLINLRCNDGNQAVEQARIGFECHNTCRNPHHQIVADHSLVPLVSRVLSRCRLLPMTLN